MSASYLYYFLSEKLSRVLSRHQAYRLGDWVSWWVYRSSRNERKNVLENLRAVLSQSASGDNLPHKVVQNYQNFGRYCVDLLYEGRRIRNLLDRTEFENLAIVDQALRGNKGVILLTAHLGNWELGAMVMAARGYPVSVIVKDHPDPRVNRFFNERRLLSGLKVIPSGTSLRKCIKALKANELIGITGDRLYAASGVDVNFFGRRVKLPKGPFYLSLKTGAPIIGAFMMPLDGGNRYRMVLTEALYPPPNDRAGDTADGYQSVARLLESMIRRFPLNWYCFEAMEESDSHPGKRRT